MTQISMYAPSGRPVVQTTYSGLIQPSSVGAAVTVDVRDFQTMQTAGFALVAGVNNLSATSDPTTSDDSTINYGPGSIWINNTLSRVWICQDSSGGAAVWNLLFQQAVP